MIKVKVEVWPDEYRGDLCVEMPMGIEEKDWRGDGCPLTADCYKDGALVGTLHRYFGNSGKSHKIAHADFYPADGVEVIRVD